MNSFGLTETIKNNLFYNFSMAKLREYLVHITISRLLTPNI